MKTLATFILILVASLSLAAQTTPDTIALTQLLKEFLDGASRNDAATHERFWANDLIYTRSSGRRVGKTDIVNSVRAAAAPQPGDPKTFFTGEDIRIQQYGDTAVVAFRLVSKTQRDGRIEVSNNLNTGTFVKRNGTWQAVAWQSTRVPRSAEEGKAEVAVAENAFHVALLTADVNRLELLTDETFSWTDAAGQRWTRQRLLGEVKSGQLKFAKLQTSNVSAMSYGETVVVRGNYLQQMLITGRRKPPSQFMQSYTLVFALRDGNWKAVAMHTSAA